MSSSSASPMPHDGTDAEARPLIVVEPSVLGLPASLWPRLLAPIAVGILVLGLWEFAVRWNGVPSYVLPGPVLIGQTLIADWATLSGSLWITLRITFLALAPRSSSASPSPCCSPSRNGWRWRFCPMR